MWSFLCCLISRSLWSRQVNVQLGDGTGLWEGSVEVPPDGRAGKVPYGGWSLGSFEILFSQSLCPNIKSPSLTSGESRLFKC